MNLPSDEQIRNTIRENLRQLRIASEKTQREIADVVGKTENAVGAWEQGLSLPDIVTLMRLASYYNKTIDYMYRDNTGRKDAHETT